MTATSSYLNKPLRTLAEAEAKCAEAKRAEEKQRLHAFRYNNINPGIVAGEGFGGKRRCG